MQRIVLKSKIHRATVTDANLNYEGSITIDEGLMQRAERLVLTFLACLLDPYLTARLGWRAGTLLVGVLALIAAGTFATAAHRTVWIATRLRRRA